MNEEKVYVIMEETSIIGIFSSKERAIEWYAYNNRVTMPMALMALSTGDYPCIEEVQLDTKWNRDR